MGIARNINAPSHLLRRVQNYSTFQLTRDQAQETLEKQAAKKFESIGIDLTKMSPELREKVKGWDAEDIRKFLAWLKEHKG